MTKDAARVSLQSIKHAYPVTHAEWYEWHMIPENAAHFKELTRTEWKERRQCSVRIEAPEGLPKPAARLQPDTDRWNPPADTWAGWLWRRSGWHMLKAGSQLRLFWLETFHEQTYYVDLDEYRIGGPRIQLGSSFKLGGVNSLSHLWDSFGGRPVAVYAVSITAEAGVNGVVATYARSSEILSPLPKEETKRRKRKAAPGTKAGAKAAPGARAKKAKAAPGAEGGSGEETDPSNDADFSAEGLSGTDPDLDGSAVSVDTDVDLGAASGQGSDRTHGTTSSSSDGEDPQKAPPVADDDADGHKEKRQASSTIWSSLWFYVTAVPGAEDMRIRMKKAFSEPDVMGHRDMSKRTLLAKHGDPEVDVLRGLIVLRAWGCSRARQRGWALTTPGRRMEVEREEAAVELAVRSFPAPLLNPLLGSDEAHECLVKWCPRVVLRLLP